MIPLRLARAHRVMAWRRTDEGSVLTLALDLPHGVLGSDQLHAYDDMTDDRGVGWTLTSCGAESPEPGCQRSTYDVRLPTWHEVADWSPLMRALRGPALHGEDA